MRGGAGAGQPRAEFLRDARRVDVTREGLSVSGHVGLPTFNKPNALHQFAYVDGRAVRDEARLEYGGEARDNADPERQQA